LFHNLFWGEIKGTVSKEINYSRVLVAHACNLSYSGGSDLEDRGWKPAWANSSQDSIWKNPITRYRPQVQTPVLQNKEKKLMIVPNDIKYQL
jgi:hypothetical protein